MQDMAYSDIVSCVKSFTELAIQNNLIVVDSEPSKMAENRECCSVFQHINRKTE